MKARGFNFGAGPAAIPEEILKEAQVALWNWDNTGMSILEVGHRTPAFMDMLAETESLCRQILNIPQTYAVLFLGGAARTQFANIPLNLLNKGNKAAYVVSGTWSEMAYQEACHLVSDAVYCIASSKAEGFVMGPIHQTDIQSDTQYLYYTPNETIVGFTYQPPQEWSTIPWVADMTSCLFSEPIDIENYDLIFAGAQKNIANAGLTLVIVRRDKLEYQPESPLPLMQDYRVQDQHQSLYATPPTFNCYLMNLMMKWIIKQGGVDALQKYNQAKAQMLYQFLDDSNIYRTFVKEPYRSILNVSFTTDSAEKDQWISQQCEKLGLYSLKGHRFLGGLRASLYNSMPIEGVEKLIETLKQLALGSH